MNLRVAKFGLFKRVWSPMWKLLLASAIAVIGIVLAIEMLYQRTLEASQTSTMNLFGVNLDTALPSSWLIAATFIVVGVAGFIFTKPTFQQKWGEVNTEIEEQMRRVQA